MGKITSFRRERGTLFMEAAHQYSSLQTHTHNEWISLSIPWVCLCCWVRFMRERKKNNKKKKTRGRESAYARPVTHTHTRSASKWAVTQKLPARHYGYSIVKQLQRNKTQQRSIKQEKNFTREEHQSQQRRASIPFPKIHNDVWCSMSYAIMLEIWIKFKH